MPACDDRVRQLGTRPDPDAGYEQYRDLVQVLDQVVDAAGNGLPVRPVEVLAAGGRVVVAGRVGQPEPPQLGQIGTPPGIGDEEKVPPLPVPSRRRLLGNPGAVDQQLPIDRAGQVQSTAHPTSGRQHLLGAQSPRHGASLTLGVP